MNWTGVEELRSYLSFSSWPGLPRPSTSFCLGEDNTWMPGTRPGMTSYVRIATRPAARKAYHTSRQSQATGGSVQELLFRLDFGLYPHW